MLHFLTYMDNLAFSSSSESELCYAHEQSIPMFKEFCMDLQKFVTNSVTLQQNIDDQYSTQTPIDNKLFGMLWNRELDTFRPKQICLDASARTRRQLLSAINSQYDLLGIFLPLMITAKLFLHALPSSFKMNSDIGDQLHSEWQKICTKLNNQGEIQIPRNMGNRDSEFALIICTDSSKLSMGIVAYLWDLQTDRISFIFAKNKLIGKNLKTKTMPVLELCSLAWGVDSIVGLYRTMTTAMIPFNIKKVIALSDSSIALSWVKSRAIKFDKIEKKAVLINNKIDLIMSACENVNVCFKHIDGNINPSDLVSRPTSVRKFLNSNFHTGPSLDFLRNDAESFIVSSNPSVSLVGVTISNLDESIFNIDKYSSFHKSARIIGYVYLFVKKFCNKMASQNENKFGHLRSEEDSLKKGYRYLVRRSQERAYPEVFKFFRGDATKEVPIVTQLNLCLDKNGIIRVRSKFGRLKDRTWAKEPVLLPRDCTLTRSLIRDFHILMQHASKHKILTAIRYSFYVPSAYSVVKSVLQRCVFCKQLFGRSLPVNTNDYRDFRAEPGKRPFQTVMIDFTSHYFIKTDHGTNEKYYILLITCMFTRAIRLYLCRSLDTISFLHALQIHIFEFGLFETLISDNQPSFDSGLKVVSQLLKEPEVASFLRDKDIKT